MNLSDGTQLYALVTVSCILGGFLGVALSWILVQRKIRAAYNQGKDQFFVQRHGVEKQLDEVSKALGEERRLNHEKDLRLARAEEELGILRRQTVPMHISPVPNAEQQQRTEAALHELERKYDSLRKRFIELSRKPGVRDTQVGAENIFDVRESLDLGPEVFSSERLLLVQAQLERIRLLIEKSLKLCDAASEELPATEDAPDHNPTQRS